MSKFQVKNRDIRYRSRSNIISYARIGRMSHGYGSRLWLAECSTEIPLLLKNRNPYIRSMPDQNAQINAEILFPHPPYQLSLIHI